jgi:apolipoprotein N-acyltransferase
LEVLRGPFFPFPGVWPIPVGWIANWLSLGYALSPQTPEAQPAALFGIYGLSMAMAASSTAFSLLLREFRLERQLWLALLGCALPLACHGYGRLVLPETAPGGTVEVAVAAQERAELQSLIDLTLSMERQRPALVVWPAVPVLSIDRANSKPEGEPHVSPDLFRDFVRQGQPTVIAGARADGDAREHGDTEAGALDERPHHAASFGEYVVIVNAEGSVLGTLYSDRGGPSRGARGHPALPFDCPSGRVGVGLGFDFDSPSRARKLSARGAGLLISVTRDGAVWGKRGTRQHASMQQFRAIENRRWLVRSSGTNAFIADPFGRLAFHLRDVEGVGGHGVEFLQERSLYTRWGWGIEPASLSGASWILVWTLVGWVKRPRRRR